MSSNQTMPFATLHAENLVNPKTDYMDPLHTNEVETKLHFLSTAPRQVSTRPPGQRPNITRHYYVTRRYETYSGAK